MTSISPRFNRINNYFHTSHKNSIAQNTNSILKFSQTTQPSSYAQKPFPQNALFLPQERTPQNHHFSTLGTASPLASDVLYLEEKEEKDPDVFPKLTNETKKYAQDFIEFVIKNDIKTAKDIKNSLVREKCIGNLKRCAKKMDSIKESIRGARQRHGKEVTPLLTLSREICKIRDEIDAQLEKEKSQTFLSEPQKRKKTRRGRRGRKCRRIVQGKDKMPLLPIQENVVKEEKEAVSPLKPEAPSPKKEVVSALKEETLSVQEKEKKAHAPAKKKKKKRRNNIHANKNKSKKRKKINKNPSLNHIPKTDPTENIVSSRESRAESAEKKDKKFFFRKNTIDFLKEEMCFATTKYEELSALLKKVYKNHIREADANIRESNQKIINQLNKIKKSDKIDSGEIAREVKKQINNKKHLMKSKISKFILEIQINFILSKLSEALIYAKIIQKFSRKEYDTEGFQNRYDKFIKLIRMNVSILKGMNNKIFSIYDKELKKVTKDIKYCYDFSLYIMLFIKYKFPEMLFYKPSLEEEEDYIDHLKEEWKQEFIDKKNRMKSYSLNKDLFFSEHIMSKVQKIPSLKEKFEKANEAFRAREELSFQEEYLCQIGKNKSLYEKRKFFLEDFLKDSDKNFASGTHYILEMDISGNTFFKPAHISEERRVNNES